MNGGKVIRFRSGKSGEISDSYIRFLFPVFFNIKNALGAFLERALNAQCSYVLESEFIFVVDCYGHNFHSNFPGYGNYKFMNCFLGTDMPFNRFFLNPILHIFAHMLIC